MPIWSKLLVAATVSCAVAAGGGHAVRAADKPIVGIIIKTSTNPFFVKMKEGAAEAAAKLGFELRTFAGKADGDTDAQIAAVESLIAAGARGILISPSDSRAIVPALEEARAKGILVIALDTPLDPPSAADATFATDNFEAGRLIGQWAAKTLGKDAAQAKIALLDLNVNQISVDVARDQGFLSGFGVDIANPAAIGDEGDKRIVGHDVTLGNEEGGRRAMETLLQRDPYLSVVYAINEPAAAGAYEALRSIGRDKDVLVVAVDGGCPGVRNVADSVIAATAMQFPLLMAQKGVEAVARFITDGTRPMATDGQDFINTGVKLVTDRPVPGLPSITTQEALKMCWG